MIGFYAYTGTGNEIDEDAAWEYIRQGYLLGPRTVLKGRTKLSQGVFPAVPGDPNKLSSELQDTLVAAMGHMAGDRRAVMFSGGFDSMLIACLAQRCGAQVTAVTVEFDEFNPLTVEGAIQVAKSVGIPQHTIHVTAAEFLSAFEDLAGITNEPILDLELAIVYVALKKYDPKIAGNVIISGMGSDQWFGDYALEVWPGGFAAHLDWANVNEDAHHKVAQAHGHRFVFPFLSGPMLALSQSIPPALKKDKKLLRALAIVNTIPHRATRSELQVPPLMRYALIKKYGDRAWPSPVSVHNRCRGSELDEALRQILLGLWLEKKASFLPREGSEHKR